MLQKLITVGNSRAFTISRDILSQIGEADIADVNFVPAKKRLIIDFDQKEIVEDLVDPEVYKVAKSLLKRYKSAFTELAKK